MSFNAKAPKFWFRRKHPAAFLLSPLGLAYGLAVRLRFVFTKPYQSRLPVICIGNFTVGGGGKTPLAIEIANMLCKQDYKPVFLTRGYGGRIKGPHLVDLSSDDVTQVGDEPLILAQTAPVVVSSDRVKGAQFIEKMNADVIIMDDGFQNPTLHKDLSLVVVDETTGVGNGRIFPAGPLRAALSFQYQRADALIICGPVPVGGRGATTKIQRSFKGEILRANLVPTGEFEWLNGTHILAMTGIARPNKFFGSLARLGASLEEIVEFPDHHVFSEQDAINILATAQKNELPIVMTQKDKVRLPDSGERGRLLSRASVLHVKMQIEQPRKLAQQLDSTISPSAPQYNA